MFKKNMPTNPFVDVMAGVDEEEEDEYEDEVAEEGDELGEINDGRYVYLIQRQIN